MTKVHLIQIVQFNSFQIQKLNKILKNMSQQKKKGHDEFMRILEERAQRSKMQEQQQQNAAKQEGIK
jgi:predicted transcriptional regulator